MITECLCLIVTTEEWKIRQTSGTRKSPGAKIVEEIKRATRRQYSYEEKIRIVLDGLRGEDSIGSQYGVFDARVIRFSDGTTGVYGGANIGTDNLEYPPADDVKLGYQAQMIGINMKYHALWQTHDFYVSKKPKLWQIMGSFLAILVSTFLILYGGLSIEFRFFGMVMLICSHLLFSKVLGLTIQRNSCDENNFIISGEEP